MNISSTEGGDDDDDCGDIIYHPDNILSTIITIIFELKQIDVVYSLTK